jgi:F-type H+-transporting ATPase subunit b
MDAFAGLGINLSGLITQIISFLILFGGLYLLLHKPVSRVLDERAERIKASLEAADRAQAEAASSAERVQQELAAARVEGQKLVADARTAAGRFREQEEARTRQEIEDMLTRARTEIERERDAAVEEVRQQFAGLAIMAAERVISRSLDGKAHRQLIDQVLQEGLQGRKN